MRPAPVIEVPAKIIAEDAHETDTLNENFGGISKFCDFVLLGDGLKTPKNRVENGKGKKGMEERSQPFRAKAGEAAMRRRPSMGFAATAASTKPPTQPMQSGLAEPAVILSEIEV